jgi:hypothetical protein
MPVKMGSLDLSRIAWRPVDRRPGALSAPGEVLIDAGDSDPDRVALAVPSRHELEVH